MKMIQPDYLILLNDVDLLKCLVVSIVCIGSGKNFDSLTGNVLWPHERTNCYTRGSRTS
jgi:hypothetical protein